MRCHPFRVNDVELAKGAENIFGALYHCPSRADAGLDKEGGCFARYKFLFYLKVPS